MAEPGAGLRERKKHRTRREISDVATRLFERDGFEAVTLAQIADAAEVSVKTIFNYFGSKEDLYFDRAAELRESLLSTVRDRRAGTSVLDALHALMRDNAMPFRETGWAWLESPHALREVRRFIAVQDRSPALATRRLVIAEELGDALPDALAGEVGRPAEALALRSLRGALVATLGLRDRVVRESPREGVPTAELKARVVAAVDEAFRRLRAAYADLDPPRT